MTMKPRSKRFTLLALLAIAVLGYGIWAAVTARRNLVTLDVRNMDVREVVKKIERQTWESILMDKDVQGKVTFNVHRMPLEDVLKIIGDQTSSRWSALYPLYSSGRSLTMLKQALRGESNPAEHGWTNLQGRGLFGGGPFGGGPFGGGPFGGGLFGAPDPGAKQVVSLEIQSKDVSFVTRAFSRYAQTRVVPEDGTTAIVSFTLNKVSIPKAVARLAKAVHRNWTRLYTLRGEFGPGGPRGPGGPPQFASRDPNGGGPNGPPPFGGRDPNRRDGRGPEMTGEQREEMRSQREALEQELKEALPAEERQKLEQAQAEREKQMEEMQNMTPEQRAQRFGQMGQANMAKMNRDRVLNTTPEQRARMGPGPGGRGPGGPPR
jgi:hypothetical protein